MGLMTIVFLAVSTSIFLQTNGKDVCVKHGILKPINRIKIKSLSSNQVSLDVTNLEGYLSQISADTPKFLENLAQINSIDKINGLVSRTEEIYPLTGYFSLIWIKGKWKEAEENCLKKKAILLNFDNPNTRPATIKFMKANSISSIPIGAKDQIPFLTNSEGVVLYHKEGLIMDRLIEVGHAKFKNTGEIEIIDAPSEDVDVFCLIPVRPSQPNRNRYTYKKSLVRIATSLAKMVIDFKTGYNEYSRKVMNLGNIPNSNSKEIKPYVAVPKFSLINVAKFLSTHQFAETFKEISFQGLKQLNEMKGIFKELAKLFKAKQNQNGIVNLPTEILELDENFKTIELKGKVAEKR